MPDLASLLALVALGALSALDGTSLGQFMLSRPLVSCTLAGSVLGDPALGVLLGGILEGAHIAAFPVGAVRLPEPGPAGVAAMVAAVGVGGPEGLALGAALGVVGSIAGGATMTLQRRMNGLVLSRFIGPAGPVAVAERLDSVENGISDRAISRGHLSCVILDAARGSLLTLAGMWAAGFLVSGAPWGWHLGGPSTVALLLLPAAVSAGALLRGWASASRRRMLFAVAFLGGWVLGVWW